MVRDTRVDHRSVRRPILTVADKDRQATLQRTEIASNAPDLPPAPSSTSLNRKGQGYSRGMIRVVYEGPPHQVFGLVSMLEDEDYEVDFDKPDMAEDQRTSSYRSSMPNRRVLPVSRPLRGPSRNDTPTSS